MRGSTTSKGNTVSIETSGHHALPRLPEPHVVADVRHETPTGRGIAKFRDKMLQKHPWLVELLAAERATSWRKGFSAGMQNHLELEHINDHPNIPVAFIGALQRGCDPQNPASGATVFIGDLEVTITVTSSGTGIPAPNTKAIWDSLNEIIGQVTAQPYCPEVIAPLPHEIATIAWANTDGQRVTITTSRHQPKHTAPTDSHQTGGSESSAGSSGRGPERQFTSIPCNRSSE